MLKDKFYAIFQLFMPQLQILCVHKILCRLMVYVLISVAPTIVLMVGGGWSTGFLKTCYCDAMISYILDIIVVTSVLLQFNKFFQVIFLHPSSTYIQRYKGNTQGHLLTFKLIKRYKKLVAI